ncbi:hypothetical protein CEXT_152971 [Caerostris extrusa]|uniref:Uncharacterized protein n=1 Tax=Caerostris extrusa TaxID=172846 RepID=A0AAV4NND9_CAEEX|nr:hypothetical protein CEXT_152971 [Caerostris extrusa]
MDPQGKYLQHCIECKNEIGVLLFNERTPAGNEKWNAAYGLKAPTVIEPSSGKSKSLIFGLRTLYPSLCIEQSLRSEMFEKPTIVSAFNWAELDNGVAELDLAVYVLISAPFATHFSNNNLSAEIKERNCKIAATSLDEKTAKRAAELAAEFITPLVPAAQTARGSFGFTFQLLCSK